MSLLKFNLIKIDLGIVYQLRESKIPNDFKRNYRIKITEDDIEREVNFFIAHGIRSDLGTTGLYLGSTASYQHKTITRQFNTNEERDLYYTLYLTVIQKFINDYKQSL